MSQYSERLSLEYQQIINNEKNKVYHSNKMSESMIFDFVFEGQKCMNGVIILYLSCKYFIQFPFIIYQAQPQQLIIVTKQTFM